MNDLLSLAQQAVSQIATTIGEQVFNVLNSLSNSVQKDIVNPITSDVSGVLGSVGNSIGQLESTATTGIAGVLTAVGNGIDNTVSRAENGFQSALSSVESGIQSTSQSIVNGLSSALGSVQQGFTSLQSGFGQALQAVGQGIQAGVNQLGTELGNAVNAIVEPLSEFIKQIPSDIATIASDVKGVLATTGDDIKRLADAAVAFTTKTAPKDIQAGLEDLALFDYNGLNSAFKAPITKAISEAAGIDISAISPLVVGRIASVAAIETALGVAEEISPSAAFIISTLLSQITEAMLTGDYRELEQAGNLGFPNKLLDIGNAVEGYYRGRLTKAELYDELARDGLATSKTDILIENERELLALNSLVTLYRRGDIPDIQTLYDRAALLHFDQEAVDDTVVLYSKLLDLGSSIELWRRQILPDGWNTQFDDLVREGWTKERIEAYQAISYKLPSIFEYQDIVARKVDDPAQVEKYGLDYGITQEYFDIARANGYDHDTAQRLYRMYWNLPPFFLLASEFKAGKISEQTFRDALAFQRFTPPWIDTFVDELAPALTEADIKEAYKYQVISGDEIAPKLESIGYTSELANEKAQIMIASVALASPNDQTSSQVTAGKVKGETESLIKEAYKDSILTRQDALTHLQSIGYTEEAADLALSITDYQLEQDNLKALAAELLDQYGTRSITLNDAINQYATAGASSNQQMLFQLKLQNASSGKSKTPTLAEMESWFKKGFISLQELASGISFLGYGDAWIPYFLQSAGAAVQDITDLGYTFTNVLLQ